MTQRFVRSIVAILFLCGASGFALQDKPSPLSNYMYQKKDLPRYEEIKKEADPQKRIDLLLEFLKERPINKLLQYIIADYQNAMNPYIEKKDWAKVTSMIETLQSALVKEEDVAKEDIPAGKEEFLAELQGIKSALRQMMSNVYEASGNLPKAAELHEEFYAAAPDGAKLQKLADLYLRMNNYDKYLEYAKKILAETSLDLLQGVITAEQVARVYLQKQDVAAASEMYAKLMDKYGDKTPPDITEAQWNPIRITAYGLLAQNAYTSKDYPKAQGLYEKLLKFDKQNGDAWYYIGMCVWQTQGAENAMDPFAKSVVLNKDTAATAKQRLEQIYKARNNDSLDGLDDVLKKAKTDLGI